ncbi:MAG: ABC transporter substrate-binding protein, partial [Caldilinea sp.]|nr:ABC transporter substrate-binding protein [Caldilinea sp.]
PADGAMLWNDNFVIPAHSTNKDAAEALINFLLRPEIAAQVIEANYYPMAHETARAYVDPAIRDDPVVYPTNEALAHAELQMPLSEEGQIQQDAAWLYVLSSIP